MKIYKLNVDENPGTATTYGIRSIPTVIVYKEGQVVNQLVGVQPEQAYIDAIG